MDVLLLIARLLLVAVFVIAGLTKLADRAGSRQALVDFGLPVVLAKPFGIILPLAELAIAFALLPPATAWWGAIGAIALLLLFVIGIGVNLARGRKPDCHCFGQLYSAPAGWPTLIRNGALAAIAAFVIWQGQGNVGPSAFGWLAALSTPEILGLVVAIVVICLFAGEGWLLFQLMGQNGRLLLRIEALEGTTLGVRSAPLASLAAGLSVDSQAPAFQLPGIYGEILTLDALRSSSKPLILIFTDPGCGPCNALLPDVSRWQRVHADKLVVAVISRGALEANRTKVAEHGLVNVLLQRDREVAVVYQAHGTPSAVLVRPDGMIGSTLAAGAEAIGQLVTQATGGLVPAMPPAPARQNGNNGHAGPAAPLALKVGDAVPMIKLPDLTGSLVDLGALRGKMTLVLFWNPGCGFCQRMLDELRAWDANPPKGAPQLLVVSTGAVEVNHAQGLRSPVLLDSSLAVGHRFGANGTPMAVLVDTQGRVASEVVAGAPGVMTLANNTHK